MRAIDADALTEDCKRYLGTLNPDKDGKECTRIHWLIGVLENAPTIDLEPCEDAVSGCTYKPDCPWYDGVKCNSPNDPTHNECDYDRGIFPESYNYDPRADVYYLAEKIGIHRLYALVVELRGEPVPCEDAVSRQAVLDINTQYHGKMPNEFNHQIWKDIKALPSVTPELCEDAVSRKDAIIQLSHNKNGDPDCDVIIQQDIETLKQLPSVMPKQDHSGDATEMVECDDAVSRTDMLNELDGWIEGFDVNGHKESHADMKLVRRSMSQLPSVTSKRKTGRWLDNYQYGYKCSECGAYLEIDCGDVEMNFCPNCNADMRGKQDE